MHLREHILKFQIKVSSQRLPVSVDYILSSGHEALLGTMSWMQVTRMQPDSVISAHQVAAHVNLRHSLLCVCGLAGAGKSHTLATKVQGVEHESVSCTVTEDFTVSDLIRNLETAVERNPASPLIQLMVSSYASMKALNHLLFQLLIEGVVADPTTGAVFGFLPDVSATIHFEIPVPVVGEEAQFLLPDAEQWHPALQGAEFGMLLHLPVLADLCSTDAQLIHTCKVADDFRYDWQLLLATFCLSFLCCCFVPQAHSVRTCYLIPVHASV